MGNQRKQWETIGIDEKRHKESRMVDSTWKSLQNHGEIHIRNITFSIKIIPLYYNCPKDELEWT